MVLAVLLAAITTGCGSAQPVSVPLPSAPSGADQRACERLAHALPVTLDGAKRRPTTPSSPLTAAYGAPPIVVVCNVGVPGSYVPSARLNVVDGVGWFAEAGDDETRFTTVLRTPRVLVAVPTAHGSAFGVLVDLAAPVSAATTARLPGG
ncbi:MAG: DUF3515 domain-containing protein [Frankiaceae bacterium]